MKNKHTEMVELAKNQIIVAIRGTENVTLATIDAVMRILANTFKDMNKVGTRESVKDIIMDVASGSILGAAHIGADLNHTSRGIMIGVLRGTKDVDAEILYAISNTTYAALREMARVGADVKATAMGLVDGAIEGAIEKGVSAENAAAAVADGAFKAAAQVGSTVGQMLRKVVTKPTKNVKAPRRELEMAFAEN